MTCKTLFVKSDNGNDDAMRNVYTAHRLYKHDELNQGTGLVSVSPAFFEIVKQCEELFDSIFKKHSHVQGILKLIVNELTQKISTDQSISAVNFRGCCFFLSLYAYVFITG